MEICDGGSLNDILERGAMEENEVVGSMHIAAASLVLTASHVICPQQVYLTEAQMAHIAVNSLKALLYLHQQVKIIHRDIKSR